MTWEKVVEGSFGTSSHSLSGLGDSVWNIWTRETEGELENPLKSESASVSFCMIFKYGHSVTFLDHERFRRGKGGNSKGSS